MISRVCKCRLLDWAPRRSPKSALDGGRNMGLTTAEMLAVIASLSRRNFYKSMTTYNDNRVWQDVYRAATMVKKDAYIKITMSGAVPVIQFKEK
jgi:motility quorum-sensing regulator/GCU-specific mRNA interferase toxin